MGSLVAITSWLLSNFILISVILAVLYVVARATKWKWDDKAIDFIYTVINLLTPGKRLYRMEDFENKTLEEIQKEEKEYREKGMLGRVWSSVWGLFKK